MVKVLKKYNLENVEQDQEEDRRKNFDLFGQLIQDVELQSPDSPDRRKSIQINLNESDTKSPEEVNMSIEIDNSNNKSFEVEQDQVQKTEIKHFLGEGYLIKNKDKRYFRIRNKVLYWYLNERSRECQNKLSLEDIDECYPDPEQDKLFHIINKNSKKCYKFKAGSLEERNIWVNEIKKNININVESQFNDIESMKIEGKPPLFKDYYLIKKLELEEKKRKEKEYQRRKAMELAEQNKKMAEKLANSQKLSKKRQQEQINMEILMAEKTSASPQQKQPKKKQEISNFEILMTDKDAKKEKLLMTPLEEPTKKENKSFFEKCCPCFSKQN